MDSIFSMDNAFFKFVGKVTDLVWLNILTLICCIPIFTMGAALSAMYRVLIKMTLKEEGTITKPFFMEFKASFKKATIVWLPIMLVLIVMIANGYLIRQGVLDAYPTLRLVATVSILIIVGFLIVFSNYYFALISRYDNEVKQSVKNAVLMILAYLPKSICILIVCASPIALMTLSNYFLGFWFLYGFSFPGYVNAMMLGSIFIKTEEVLEN